MTHRPHLLLALALALAALRPAAALAAPAAPPPTAAERAAKAAADLEAALDELKLQGVGPEQRKLLARYAAGDFCYCGCPHTVASCLLRHKACQHSARQLRLAAGVLAAAPSSTPEQIQQFVGQYYSSFDRRAKIDLDAFGPPLGDEKAPVTLVEYSDFTCPFCQSFRPVLEAFVADHPGRVKLYFKPFPIESHAGAVELAIAGEWGRQQGAFWRFHDLLFSGGHDLDTIADAAQSLGLDASDLRDAVTSRRFEQKVTASRTEGQQIGVRSTPRLFMNGRALDLPDNTADWLQFALEDEEELLHNHGKWARD
jgi:protein-disulfide isomerase